MHYSVPGAGNAIKCKGCPRKFVPTRKWQEFCSKSCRTTYHSRDEHGREPSQAERITALERRVAELEQAVELVRGHLAL